MRNTGCRVWISVALLALANGSMTLAAADSEMPALALPEVLARVETAQQAIKSIRLDFREHWDETRLNHPDVTGKLAFKRAHHLRIDQTKPESQTVVSDGQTLRVLQPSAGQLLEGDWQKYLATARLPLPLLGFTGDFPVSKWSERYQVLFGGADHHLYRIDFKPLKSTDDPLTLWISDDSFLPARGKLKGNDGVLTVEIHNLRQNGKVSDAFFQLQIPKNTAVVPLPT